MRASLRERDASSRTSSREGDASSRTPWTQISTRSIPRTTTLMSDFVGKLAISVAREACPATREACLSTREACLSTNGWILELINHDVINGMAVDAST
eukprot:CAMPEP_0179888338 /NCGR_PEP_ID=MMETSP0982-20121206/31904_1 /TAXON_ID=483367 /ORGANISM="non described non described, Strain CCMP 2436" /LENGTH=97 /DNA_ID=CAMNT_0021784265 /DNA_START=12 /DNA_END=301 /DNA_ORIENTATION=+